MRFVAQLLGLVRHQRSQRVLEVEVEGIGMRLDSPEVSEYVQLGDHQRLPHEVDDVGWHRDRHHREVQADLQVPYVRQGEPERVRVQQGHEQGQEEGREHEVEQLVREIGPAPLIRIVGKLFHYFLIQYVIVWVQRNDCWTIVLGRLKHSPSSARLHLDTVE